MATVDQQTASTVSSPPALEPLPYRQRCPGGEAGSRWKFDVADYYKMAEVGILRQDDRVELIDGDIVLMSPIGRFHASVTVRLSTLFFRTLGERATVSPGHPIHLNKNTEPQPDLQLLRPRDDYYQSRHPTPDDVFLLVEVMDSSAPFDRGKKLALYARAEVSEVWLVDVNRQIVEVCRRPVEGVYTDRREFPRGQGVTPEAFPDVVVGVDDILG